MSKLSFSCEYETSEPQDLVLPVEIRKSNMALVTKTLSSQPVKLDPGKYFVVAHLPSGQELYNEVTIGDQPETLVKLFPDPNEKPPADKWGTAGGIGSDSSMGFSDGAKGLESLGAGELEAQARVFRGNPLSGPLEMNANPFNDVRPGPAPARGEAELLVQAPPQTILQVLQPGMPAVNAFLPAPRWGGDCTVRLSLQPGVPLDIQVRLDNSLADSLLRFYANGLITQASSLIDNGSPELLSEDLLQSKMADPIAACVGAYSLIRLGNLEKLHDWTQNLMDFFPWLPDGAALRAEHLARTGDHKNAMAALRELPSRGLPYFTDGLSYVSSRLRTYAQVEDDPEDGADFKGAKALLKQITPFVTCANFNKPILIITGLNPRKPDTKVLGASLENYDGMDISLFFG